MSKATKYYIIIEKNVSNATVFWTATTPKNDPAMGAAAQKA
jgi:hypothetical protein